MKKSIKKEFMLLIPVLVLIVGSFASMFLPIVSIPNGNYSSISFYDAIRWTKGLSNSDSIPYCGAIITSIIALGLAFILLTLLVVFEAKKGDELFPKFFKKRRNYDVTKIVFLVFSLLFLIISCVISYCAYPAFMGLTRWSGIFYNFSNNYYGCGNWITGSILFIALCLTIYYFFKYKPNMDY